MLWHFSRVIELLVTWITFAGCHTWKTVVLVASGIDGSNRWVVQYSIRRQVKAASFVKIIKIMRCFALHGRDTKFTFAVINNYKKLGSEFLFVFIIYVCWIKEVQHASAVALNTMINWKIKWCDISFFNDNGYISVQFRNFNCTCLLTIHHRSVLLCH